MTDFHSTGIFPILIIGVIVLRIFADYLDRQRIRDHVEGSGGKILNISWNPLGRGWFGSRNERIYEVHYRAKNGRTVEATCKTSMLSGVYWTSDSAPSDFMDMPETPDACAEPVKCLACGSTIPSGKSRCPKCRWSYKDK